MYGNPLPPAVGVGGVVALPMTGVAMSTMILGLVGVLLVVGGLVALRWGLGRSEPRFPLRQQ